MEAPKRYAFPGWDRHDAWPSRRPNRPSKTFWRPSWPLRCGVVALTLQGGAELDGGDEEGARFADRLEVAVHFDRPGAVAVAEHASVHLGAQFAHLGTFVVPGSWRGWS